MSTTDGADLTGLQVLLVDDHDVIRAGLAMLLAEVVGVQTVEAHDPESAKAVMESGTVDLVLLDVHLGAFSGIDVLRDLRVRWPDTPVLMLSTFDGPEDVVPSLDAGASGYVLKDATPEQLRDAMAAALAGEGMWLSPSAAARAFSRRSAERSDGPQLSDRERDIVRLLVQGATNDEIAAALFVSTKTVKSQLSTLFRKLDVTNRTQAVAASLRAGLVGIE